MEIILELYFVFSDISQLAEGPFLFFYAKSVSYNVKESIWFIFWIFSMLANHKLYTLFFRSIFQSSIKLILIRPLHFWIKVPRSTACDCIWQMIQMMMTMMSWFLLQLTAQCISTMGERIQIPNIILIM